MGKAIHEFVITFRELVTVMFYKFIYYRKWFITWQNVKQ